MSDLASTHPKLFRALKDLALHGRKFRDWKKHWRQTHGYCRREPHPFQAHLDAVLTEINAASGHNEEQRAFRKISVTVRHVAEVWEQMRGAYRAYRRGRLSAGGENQLRGAFTQIDADCQELREILGVPDDYGQLVLVNKATAIVARQIQRESEGLVKKHAGAVAPSTAADSGRRDPIQANLWSQCEMRLVDGNTIEGRLRGSTLWSQKARLQPQEYALLLLLRDNGSPLEWLREQQQQKLKNDNDGSGPRAVLTDDDIRGKLRRTMSAVRAKLRAMFEIAGECDPFVRATYQPRFKWHMTKAERRLHESGRFVEPSAERDVR